MLVLVPLRGNASGHSQSSGRKTKTQCLTFSSYCAQKSQRGVKEKKKRRRSRIHLLENQAVIRLLWTCVSFPLINTQMGGGWALAAEANFIWFKKKKDCYGPGNILFLYFIACIVDLQGRSSTRKTLKKWLKPSELQAVPSFLQSITFQAKSSLLATET